MHCLSSPARSIFRQRKGVLDDHGVEIAIGRLKRGLPEMKDQPVGPCGRTAMKFRMFEIGACFEFEGKEYVRTGPLTANSEGRQRMILEPQLTASPPL